MIVLKHEQDWSEAPKKEETDDAVIKMETSYTTTTPSDTEAATILTTIKGGEIISNQQQCFDLLNQFESSTIGASSSFKMDIDQSQPNTSQASTNDASMTALVDQVKTENGDEQKQFMVSDDDIFKNFTSGPLDALASAALQASTNQQNQTVAKKVAATSAASAPKVEIKKQIKTIPKEEVTTEFIGPF